MNSALPSSQPKPLPNLRRDIKIYRGPDEVDGSPTYNCLDPVTAQYFKIGWAEMTILQHFKPGMTLTMLIEEIHRHSTLKVEQEEVLAFFEEAARHHLLEFKRPSEYFLSQAEQREVHPFIWLLYHYLYIRLPLVNPDHFLSVTLPYVRPLVSRFALSLYLVLTCCGLFLLIERFNEFLSTFSYFFNARSFFIYALAISLVKLIHEFAHAYVAKFYRLHVPTMGVAFIVLWPVLYTDVTDGWKLNKRRQRLMISAAGVMAEIILAGLSTLGWALSSPGLLQSVFFVISSATWISTLLVNLNPAMRFDGYYLMSDLLGVDNLQYRAFAYTRWQLRKWFLGLDMPPPESFSFKRRLFLLFYSIYTWIYRLVLYTAIALLVYHKFTKTLGIFLFLIEIAFFIAPPFLSEGKQLIRLSSYLSINRRSFITLLVLTSLVVWFIFPVPHRAHFSALTIPKAMQILYTAREGKIKSINFELDQHVRRGDLLVALESPALELQITKARAEIQTIQAEGHVLSLQEKERSFLPKKRAELATFEAKLQALLQQRDLLNLRATIEGTVYAKDDRLQVGQYVYPDQVLGQVGTLNQLEIISFIPEDRLQDVYVGQSATFRARHTLKDWKGKIVNIIPARATTLSYPQLAALYRGELPTVEVEAGKVLLLLESYFILHIELENSSDLKMGERGQLTIWTSARSLLWDFIQRLESIYWQESGF